MLLDIVVAMMAQKNREKAKEESKSWRESGITKRIIVFEAVDISAIYYATTENNG